MSEKDLTKLFTPEEEKSTPELQQHVKEFYDLVMAERALKKDLEELQEKRIAAEETLYSSLENANFELIRTENGTFSRRIDLYANFEPGKKEEGFIWLRDQGFGDLIYETVNVRTFSAFIKDFKKDEMAELPEFVNTSLKRKIGFRKK